MPAERSRRTCAARASRRSNIVDRRHIGHPAVEIDCALNDSLWAPVSYDQSESEHDEGRVSARPSSPFPASTPRNCSASSPANFADEIESEKRTMGDGQRLRLMPVPSRSLRHRCTRSLNQIERGQAEAESRAAPVSDSQTRA
jgi:hypothetical protein